MITGTLTVVTTTATGTVVTQPVVISGTLNLSVGPKGEDGAAGEGVPVGGTTGQVLAKIDTDDYNTEWVDPPAGTGATVDSINGETGIVVLTTDDISEGANNAYYTDARVAANSSVAANTSHAARTDNPHIVQESQIPAGIDYVILFENNLI